MTNLYASFYRTAWLPVWEGLVRRRPTLHIEQDLLRTQWESPDALVELQERALRRLARHAFDAVPHYARAFARAGVGPDDVRTRADLAKLPVLARSEAQASEAERRSTRAPLVDITKSTSGSTGEPLRFGYDRGSEHWRQAVKLRGYGWAGWQPGLRTLHLWGSADIMQPKSWQQRAKVATDRWLRRDLYIDANTRSEADLEHIVHTIRGFEPGALICYAQAGAELARYVNASGARTWEDLPVICAAERLFAPDRAELERAFGARVFETYGCREVMLIAAECPAHAGLHISMENLIVELLVAEDGSYRAARPGEIGQVAITDLHNFGMPFIRYLNGDLAVAAPPGRCACGRGLDRLISIEGRQNDTLVAADGRSIDSLFFNVLFVAQGGKVKRFQAVQHKDGAVVLRVVPAAEFDDDVRKRLVDASARVLGDVPFELALVDEIPVAESGKRRVVVVER